MDLLLCSMPWTNDSKPVLAPALLKSCVTRAGFSCKTMDLNARIYRFLKNHPQKNLVIDFFQQQNIHPDARTVISDLISSVADSLLEQDARVLGMSLLSQDCQFFTMWLCYHIKWLKPSQKILIGGSGVKNFIAQPHIDFARQIQKLGLIDDFIYGDGEQSLIQYLSGDRGFPGINSQSWQQIDDLDSMPFADFSDYDWNDYDTRGIPICDSRGCVRTCEFCDIIEHWKKYKYRSAENIWREILQHINDYGIRQFFFYNSLTNGNMKEFTKLLDLMCEYNRDRTKQDQISWRGYFIVRNSRQHPESMWQKLRDSNATLELGIESVVEHVRIGLGKKFSNDDIDYHLEMSQKYQVPVMLLLIIAYPTESIQDWAFTMQWFRDRAEFASNSVYHVQCTLSAILPNTGLDRNAEKYGITHKGEFPVAWIQPQSNEIQRMEYLAEIQQILKECGFQTSTDKLTFNLINQG